MKKSVFLGCSAAAALMISHAADAATLRGRVLDAAHNAALPGATVTLSTGATTVTGDDGRFEFSNVADGAQQVTVDYVGFTRASQSLTASDNPAVTDIVLTPEGTDTVIVVTGTRLAEARALQTKRSDNRFIEALYANDVGKLPDQNVAEAVKRLPGISVANDQGEGRYVIIRGIDPNLVNVSINGQTMPAPEPDGRQVKLDDIPSAMIASVEVSKSLSPDQDANAIGGEVNIRTLTAFDRNKPFFLDARGSVGRYNINGKTPWEADGQVGGLFGADKQFGAVISVNYSRRPITSENYQGSDSWEDQNGVMLPDQQGLRDYNLVRTRLGVVGNFDWRPSDTAKLYLRTSYSRFTDNEYRDQNILGSEANFRNQTGATGTFDAAATIQMRRRRENDNTKSATLGGDFDVGAGKLEVSGGFTRAIKKDPVRSEFQFKGPTTAVNYDLSTSPFSFIPQTAVFDDPSKFTFAKVNFDHRFAYENLWQVRADYTIPVAIGDDSTIKVGAKYLDRKKSDDEESLAYKAVKGVKWTMDNVAFTGDTGFYDDMFHFGQRIDYDAAANYAKTASPAVMALDESGSIADSLAADYRVREKIIAGYAMATLKFGGLTLVPGIRVEHTKDETAAKVIDDDSQFGDGYNSFGDKSYTDWFPGLTARYNVNDRLVLRGAVTTAIGRPAYTQLAPYVLVDSGEDPASIEVGNPDLKPLKAVNLDAAAEYYLPGQGLLSVGLFYKHIDNPIYSQSERVTGQTFGGRLYDEADVTRPINVDSEIVKGIEVNAQTRFTFLPAPFDGLGVSANYTHVSGHAKGVEDRPGDIPLFFQSHDIGTAQLFYEKYGATVRIAYSYRSKYLDTLGGSADEDQYTDNNGQLDVHASYQITPQVTVFGDATNLTDAPWRRFIGTKALLVERERYDYSLRGGVQVHF